MILNSQRHLFDIPEDVAYFNCAYLGPLLHESARRLHEGVDFKFHPWKIVPDDLFDSAEVVRNLLADIFGGDSNGFAIVPSVSYGMSTASRILETKLKPNDEILLIEEEFPSVVFPFRAAANVTGATIKTILKPEDGNWTNAILNGIIENVKVVAISSCHWTNGAFIDLLAIRKKCNEYDAVFVIDGTQSFSVMPFSIDEIQPDFMVSVGYKWMLCPYGFSFMYVNEKWRNERPLEETWLARENARDFTKLVNYCDTYMDGARRFEVGQKCTPTILPGAIAALEQIKNWGVNNISDTLSNINKKIEVNLSDLGFQLPESSLRCPHILGAKVPFFFNGNLVNELKENKIFISQRGESLRIAPHLYINDNDIHRLNDTISKIIKK
jgi:selenocysteine lyase/cysteine desulfurase